MAKSQNLERGCVLFVFAVVVGGGGGWFSRLLNMLISHVKCFLHVF